jgi:hypothetical protein
LTQCMTAQRLSWVKISSSTFFFFFGLSEHSGSFKHTMSDVEENVAVEQEQPVVKKGKTGKYRKEKRKKNVFVNTIKTPKA